MYPNTTFTSVVLPQTLVQTEAQHSTSGDAPHAGTLHKHVDMVSLSPFPQLQLQVPAPNTATWTHLGAQTLA